MVSARVRVRVRVRAGARAGVRARVRVCLSSPSGSGVKVLKSGKIHTGATNMSTTCKVVSK